MKFLLVFIGGGVGSALRYYVGKFFVHTNHSFFNATLTVNVLGSVLIGILFGYFTKQNLVSQNQSILLITGFCGGFTTFSTFALENATMLKNGDYFSFAFYTILAIILGVLAVFLGLFLMK